MRNLRQKIRSLVLALRAPELSACVRAVSFGLAGCALFCLLSCSGAKSNANAGKSVSNANPGKAVANSSKANVNSRKSPRTLDAPSLEFLVGTWQRTDTAPGDWVFEFRRDGSVTFTVMMTSTTKLDRYEGTYLSTFGWVVLKTLDGEPLEKQDGYDVRFSDEEGEILIAGILSGDRRAAWDTYRRVGLNF